MQLSFRLGWRSMVRHTRRTIITMAAISLSLALMLMFVGIAEDGHARMAQMGIRLGSGHVVIQGAGYQEEQTLDHLIDDPARIAAAARAVPGVAHTAARVQASGLLSAGEHSSSVILSGVDPATEPRVSDIAAPANTKSGHYLRRRADMEFPKGPADIYLGDELARALEVRVGDRVVVTVSPLGDSRPAAAAFIVRGTFQTGLGALDESLAQIPLEEAQSLLRLGSKVTQVAVLLDSLKATDAATAALDASLGPNGGLEVLSWKVALRELYEAIELDDLSLYLMMAIIFVIVAIGIFNTVLMSVTERTREMGVMMALGTSKTRLFSMIMAEAVLLALLGAAVGVALGLVGHVLVARYGIDVGALMEGDYEFAGVAFTGKIYSTLTARDVTRWASVVVALVIVSALVPALRATRLEPVEAMRHV